jgi:hypothetical protein
VSLRLSLLLSVALLGCSAFGPTGPTAVARGEYYAAGKPEFDSFFIELHRLQVELNSANAEPRAVRQSLALSAGLGPEASDESLKNRLEQELKKLAGQGLRLRLEVPEVAGTADASATLHTSESSQASAWRSSLPRDATRLVRSRNRMFAARDQLERLRVAGIQLEGSIDPTFRVDGPWKKSEVRRNLEDGQKIITLMSARTKDVEAEDTKLLRLLAEAANTDSSLGKSYAPALPPAEPAAAPAKPGKRPPAAKSPGPKAPTPPQAAKPAPVSKPSASPKPRSDDDAPAPKPVQGNAPAEIEP